jgi:hypothetical protein
MKKILFLALLLIAGNTFSQSHWEREKALEQANLKTYYGNILSDGQWKKVKLVIDIAKNTLISSEDSWNGFRQENSRILELNPNNQYAIQYNYTHYAQTYYGVAYFVL